MLGKNKIKFINSLKLAKYRDEYNQFIVEGEKIVNELLNTEFIIHTIICTKEVLNAIKNFSKIHEIIEVTDNELKKISSLTTPNKVLAIAEIPKYSYSFEEISNSLSISLDDIQDPGNIGTIIRIADWFGISNIFCSPNCVDIYNPKVVQSTMGAIFRVKVHYVNLPDFFNDCKKHQISSIYGTYLEGENIYCQDLSNNGIIVMGNESKGISKNLEQFINKKLYIPNFATGKNLTESLNVSAATAIVCSEFRRQNN